MRTVSGITVGVEPNLLHNEGAVQLAGDGGTTRELEIEIEDGDVEAFFNHMVVVPAARNGAFCQIGGGTPVAIRTGIGAYIDNTDLPTATAAVANYLNKVNDKFEDGECHLVAAFGFGNDAAKSTTVSAVAIAAAPSYVSNTINPSKDYSRYIALFHLGNNSGGNTITAANIFRKPVFVGIVDPEGKLIDQNIAVASTASAQQ